jgi:hypothetical protein
MHGRWQGVRPHPRKYEKNMIMIKFSPYMHPSNKIICIHRHSAPSQIYSSSVTYVMHAYDSTTASCFTTAIDRIHRPVRFEISVDRWHALTASLALPTQIMHVTWWSWSSTCSVAIIMVSKSPNDWAPIGNQTAAQEQHMQFRGLSSSSTRSIYVSATKQSHDTVSLW